MHTLTGIHKQQGLQTAAVLLLCRFVFFVCAEIPFSTGYAVGTLLSIGVQILLCLPLWMNLKAAAMPRLWLMLYRLIAIYAAGALLSAVFQLLRSLQAAHPAITLVMMLAAACYALTLPRRATGRVAVILLFFLCAGAAAVIVSAVIKGEPLMLYTAMPEQDLFRTALAGFSQNLPVAFLPLCALPYASSPKQRRPWLLGWLAGQLVFVLVIVAGTLCCGRLAQWKGNPFFLLPAQLQRDTAIRLDGFWIGLLILSAVMALAFFMQILTTAMPERTPHTGEALLIGGVILFSGILFIMFGESTLLTGLLVVLAAGVMPLFGILRTRRRSGERSRT